MVLRAGPAAPGGAAAGRPRYAGPKPGRKMRQLHWEKLPEMRVANTKWETMMTTSGPAAAPSAPASSAASVVDETRIDFAELESLFGAIVASARPRASGGAARKEQVLDTKRATGMGILMSRMRVHWTEMPRAILRMSPSAFRTIEDVETVMGILPTDDEAKLLRRFLEKSAMNVRRIGGGKGGGKAAAALAPDRPVLSDAEEFALLLLAEVPTMLQRRVQLLHVAMATPVLLDEIEAGVDAYVRAVRQLRGSACFHNVVKMTLIVGNFMNHGTRLGDAAGFRLSALMRLKDTRAGSGQMTLLHYIVKTMMRALPEACDLAAELPGFARSAMRAGLDEVLEGYAKVVRNLATGRGVLSTIEARGDTGVVVRLRAEPAADRVRVEVFEDALRRTAAAFVAASAERAAAVRTKILSLRADLDEAIASFGEGAPAPAAPAAAPGDPAGLDPGIFGAAAPEFIENIVSFVGSYDLALRQFERERREEEERLRRRSQTKLRAAARAAGVAVSLDGSPAASRGFRKDQGYGFPKHEEPIENDARAIDVGRTEAAIVCRLVLEELLEAAVAG